MELRWLLEDSTTSEPITGAELSTSISVRRESDGYYLKWEDNTFDATGGLNKIAMYEEVNQYLLPGVYAKTIDTSLWQDDTYSAMSYYTSASYFSKVDEFFVVSGVKYSTETERVIAELKASIDSMNAKIYETPAASLLSQEYYTNEDMDGNGLIYGIDFYISTGRPKMLDYIPKRGVPMTWTEYLASV